eukprot:TRINITY_DN6665_c0_g1_i2.p1 TRINITY_DN6665_c0_g1~~TRINITY_DN6665_c0_g1_i2.p1  ORF type:complete len:165 (-),score=22.26 TRINITY_DN6665_c0_g1_i2:44-538(-)
MLRMLTGLNASRYTQRTYVVADTDTHSSAKVAQFEEAIAGEYGAKAGIFNVSHIPRSREVRQSYITSIFTTLRACFHALSIVWSANPDVVISNGPGTAVPICVCAYLFSFLGLQSTTIIYVESICRVKHLSLSATLLRPFVNRLIVQWPGLQFRGIEYYGFISQ